MDSLFGWEKAPHWKSSLLMPLLVPIVVVIMVPLFFAYLIFPGLTVRLMRKIGKRHK